MTGWRLGYAAGPKEIIRAMSEIQGHFATGANTVSQSAGWAPSGDPRTR